MRHDEIIERILSARAAIPQRIVAEAFVASLATRRLSWRSALGSYAVCLNLERHLFSKSVTFAAGLCKVCGLPKNESFKWTYDENGQRIPYSQKACWRSFTLARERGPGRCSSDLLYTLFDLETFPALPVQRPSASDYALFNSLLAAIAALPGGSQLSNLSKAIPKAIPANKLERQNLLEILGYSGILCPPDQVSFLERFVGYEERELRQPEHSFKCEWEYPVQHWTGKAGVNQQARAFWFPEPTA